MTTRRLNKLTPDQEQAIGRSLDKVASLIDAGETPDDAIVKVAEADKLAAGHVNLMVQAYNVGRTVSHIQNSSDRIEKAAEFLLAHPDVVMERLFPAVVKSAAEQQRDVRVSADYARSPASILRSHAHAVKVAELTQVNIKEAFAKLDAERTGVTKAPELPREPIGQFKQALNVKNAAARAVVAAKDQLVQAGYAVVRELEKLGTYFKASGCIPWAEVKENVALVRGQVAGQLMDKVAEANKALLKQASHKRTPVDWAAEPYSLVSAAMDAIDAFQRAEATVLQTEKEATAKAADALRPFVQTSEPAVITGSLWDHRPRTEKRAEIEGSLFDVGMGAALGATASGVAERLLPLPKEELIKKKMQDLQTGPHEFNLARIRTQSMLHDMMLNDPVISGYKPDQVIEAFNRISEVAPHAAQSRLVAQALIRKYLEQASVVDPYDVDQLLDVERKLPQEADAQKALMSALNPGKAKAGPV